MKRVLYRFLILFAIIAAGVFISKDYFTDYIKMLIEDQLVSLISDDVTIESVSISPFPGYIALKGLSIKNDNNSSSLSIDDSRFYFQYLPLIRKSITIHKVYLNKPVINADSAYLKELHNRANSLQSKLKSSPEKNRSSNGNVSLSINPAVIHLHEGRVSIKENKDEFKLSVGSARVKRKQVLKHTTGIKIDNISYYSTKMNGIKNNTVSANSIKVAAENKFGETLYKINKLDIRAKGLKLKSKGVADCSSSIKDCRLSLKNELFVKVDAIKRLFDLKEKGEGEITLSGMVSYDGHDSGTDLALKGDFYLETLMEFLKVKNKQISGKIDVTGKVDGPLSSLRASGTATMKAGNLFGVEIDSLTSDVSYENSELKFLNGKGELYGGKGEVEAMLKLPHVKHFSLSVNSHAVDSEGIFDLIGWHPGLSKGKIELNLITEGEHFKPHIRFTYLNQDMRPEESHILKRIKNVTGELSLKKGVVDFENLTLSTEQSKGVVKGAYHIKEESLNFNTLVTTQDVAYLSGGTLTMINAGGEFKGVIKGPKDKLIINGIITMKKGMLYDIPFSSMKSAVKYSKDRMIFKNAGIDLFEGGGSFNGTIDFQNAKDIFDFDKPGFYFNIDLKDLNTKNIIKAGLNSKNDDFINSITGMLDTAINVESTSENTTFNGNLEVRDLKVKSTNFDILKANYTLNNDSLSLKDIILERGDSFVKTDATINKRGDSWTDEKSLSYTVDSGVCEISTEDIPFEIFGLNSDIYCLINGKGSFSDPSLTIEVSMVEESAIGGIPLGKGNLKILLNSKGVNAEGLIFDEKTSVNGYFGFDKERPWSLDLKLKAHRYDFLFASLSDKLPDDFFVTAGGKISLTGKGNSIVKGNALLPNLAISTMGFKFSNASDIKLIIKKDSLSIESFNLMSDSAKLTLQGEADRKKGYNLTLNGTAPLRLLKGYSQSIERVSGNSDFQLNINGLIQTPLITGAIKINKGYVNFKNLRHIISSIDGELSLESNTIIISKIHAKYGGGTLTLRGKLNYKEFRIDTFFIQCDLKNITTSIAEDFQINLDGNVRFKGDENKKSLLGDIELVRAKYTKDLRLKDLMFEKTQQNGNGSTPEILKNTELNLRIFGEKNISIKNNFADTPVKADLFIKGTSENPALLGRLEADGGKVFFRKNEFDILNGNVDFIGENIRNPYIDLTAETTVKGYNVTLSLNGRVEKFDLSLSSTPPLNEVDIMTLLTFGEVGSKLKGMESGIGTQEATSFLTGKFQDAMGMGVEDITGLDRFQVTSNVSEQAATVRPQITLSKKFLADKFNATLSSSIGQSGEEVVKVEYLFSNNVSLIGERNEIGSVGGDIKFRFKFK